MEDTNAKVGLLLKPNNLVQRRCYFRECVKLIGRYVIYRAPKPEKHWTTYAELETNYEPPILVGCIFHEHPTQKTLKKIGWVSELQEGSSLIEVEYDLPRLQIGSLFIVPSNYDNSEGRLFRVISMSSKTVYPSSVTCEIAPEYEDTMLKVESLDYTHSSTNLLNVDESGWNVKG